jgi:hypothetical protein
MSRELGRFTLVKNENLTSGVWQETGFREVNDKRDTSHYKNEEVVGEICVDLVFQIEWLSYSSRIQAQSQVICLLAENTYRIAAGEFTLRS